MASLSCIQYQILMLNEIDSEIPSVNLQQNLLDAVWHCRKFDKLIVINSEELFESARSIVTNGLELIRPHTIIEILVEYKRFDVAMQLITRHDLNECVFTTAPTSD